MSSTDNTMPPEMQALKQKLKTTWMAGDYGHFAKFLEPDALAFLARLNLQPDQRLLDVACGAGQIVIPAARAGIAATGVDIATNSILRARERATEEGLTTAHFDEGDAEALPYADAAFDVVSSLFGAMFAPRPDHVAAELLRVCRPGGRIVMGNWTPQGHVGQMFKVIGRHVPPSPLMASPLAWGDEATVRDRLGHGAAHIIITRRNYAMRYPFGPADVVEFFITYYGPTNRAHAALDGAGQAALRADLEQLWAASNRAVDGSTQVESEFLEVEVVRR